MTKKELIIYRIKQIVAISQGIITFIISVYLLLIATIVIPSFAQIIAKQIPHSPIKEVVYIPSPNVLLFYQSIFIVFIIIVTLLCMYIIIMGWKNPLWKFSKSEKLYEAEKIGKYKMMVYQQTGIIFYIIKWFIKRW